MYKEKKGFNTIAIALAKNSAGAQGFIDFIIAAIKFNDIFCPAGYKKFYLVQNYWNTKSWYKDEDNLWRGESAYSFQQKESSDKILEVVIAKSFSDLDWKKSSFYVEKGKSGWLNPEGIFYGCHFCGHSALAQYVIRKPYHEIEQPWVHVDSEGGKGKSTFRNLGPLTPAQEKWLEQNGHDLDPQGYKKRKELPKVIEIDGYKIDAAADKAAFERMMALAPKQDSSSKSARKQSVWGSV